MGEGQRAKDNRVELVAASIQKQQLRRIARRYLHIGRNELSTNLSRAMEIVNLC